MTFKTSSGNGFRFTDVTQVQGLLHAPGQRLLRFAMIHSPQLMKSSQGQHWEATYRLFNVTAVPTNALSHSRIPYDIYIKVNFLKVESTFYLEINLWENYKI